jgi:RING-variant domain
MGRTAKEDEKLNKRVKKDQNLPVNRSIIKVGEIENQNDYKCRICLGMGDMEEEMCSPCECSGSVTYIHVTCLKEWIKEKRSIKCELCGSNYSKKWKVWAEQNRIIAFVEKGTPTKVKIAIFLKTFNITYICIIVVLMLYYMIQPSNGLKDTS